MTSVWGAHSALTQKMETGTPSTEGILQHGTKVLHNLALLQTTHDTG